jgi:hypothetical protein
VELDPIAGLDAYVVLVRKHGRQARSVRRIGAGIGRVRTHGTADDGEESGNETGETTHDGPRRQRVDFGMGPSLY